MMNSTGVLASFSRSNLQIFTDSSCRRRPASRKQSQQWWDLDPGLRRDDDVLPRLMTAQRGKLLAITA
jgi:hypothetical protein